MVPAHSRRARLCFPVDASVSATVAGPRSLVHPARTNRNGAAMRSRAGGPPRRCRCRWRRRPRRSSAYTSLLSSGRRRSTRQDVEAFIALKRREGKATKSILNYIGLLHSIFSYAERRGVAKANPVKLVEKPERPGADPDICFLDQAELEALLKAVPDDVRGSTERAIYLTAANDGPPSGRVDWASLA